MFPARRQARIARLRPALTAMLHAAPWADTALAILGVGLTPVAAWPVLAGAALPCSVKRPKISRENIEPGRRGITLTSGVTGRLCRYRRVSWLRAGPVER